MSRFQSYTVFYGRQRYLVASLRDAKAVSEILAQNDVDSRLAEVCDLIDRARSGHLAPRVALTAFETYARQQSIYKPVEKSAAVCGFPSTVRDVRL